ncbi:MAG: methionyl-tRNA formyltransferase [Parasporobacterium sp.]|nr:methionyl-tRNA formyltransferase [Parasporobacterium sp.]
MKIIFMGTPDIAVPALETLIGSRHEVIAVVTQPDQKSGRGMNLRISPVKNTALKYNIPCLQPEKISEPDVMDQLEKLGADIFAVAAYSQKIPDRILEMTEFGCINLHPSLLPKYRGSGPLRGPILNGDPSTGVTIMKLVQEWDAGDILLQKEFVLDGSETSEYLEQKCSVLGAEMMLEVINGLEDGTVSAVPQDHSKATYLKQITKDAGLIKWEESAVQIERQIRACIPWPSAYTSLEGKTFKIWEADVIDEASAEAPGTTIYADKKKIAVNTGRGLLVPLSVQLEGKKRMSMEEFLRGRKIEQGTRFGN